MNALLASVDGDLVLNLDTVDGKNHNNCVYRQLQEPEGRELEEAK
jgi:hypothetical protein